jgi:hemolysin III
MVLIMIDRAWSFAQQVAASVTPVAVLALPETGWYLLLSVWIFALVGCILLLVGKAHVSHHFFTGITIAVSIVEMHRQFTTLQFALTLLALVCSFGLGGLVYIFNRPNPYPQTFGYHEVFDSLLLVAHIATYIINYTIIYQYAAQKDMFPFPLWPWS